MASGSSSSGPARPDGIALEMERREPPDSAGPLSSAKVYALASPAAFDLRHMQLVMQMERILAMQRAAAARVGQGQVGDGKEDAVVLDVRSGGGGDKEARAGDESLPEEVECRICHLGSDPESATGRRPGADLIQLGCDCKDGLGTAHRNCAESWFSIKGNRYCEICGVYAKNISGNEDVRFLEEWNEGRRASNVGSPNPTESGCWRRQPLCKFLIAFLIIAFILPWFIRVNVF